MKYLLPLLLLLTSLDAGLINGVALVVNGEPITLLEIEDFAQKANMDKTQAQLELTRQVVAKKMAKELHIEVGEAEVEAQIDMIKKKNDLTTQTLKEQLELTGIDYETFYKQIKTQQLQQRLTQALTYEKVKEPTPEEMHAFYEQHEKEFALPKSIDVTEYRSQNRNSLESILRSPLFAPKDVISQDKTLKLATMNPQLVQLLLTTKVDSYTQILPLAGNMFGMFYINGLGEMHTPSYEEVEGKLGQVIQSKKRQDIVALAYKEALLKADIEYLRVQKISE